MIRIYLLVLLSSHLAQAMELEDCSRITSPEAALTCETLNLEHAERDLSRRVQDFLKNAAPASRAAVAYAQVQWKSSRDMDCQFIASSRPAHALPACQTSRTLGRLRVFETSSLGSPDRTADFKAADQELSEAYQRLIALYSEQPKTRTLLKEVQLAWIASRAADQAAFTADPDLIRRLTMERTVELRSWTGTPTRR